MLKSSSHSSQQCRGRSCSVDGSEKGCSFQVGLLYLSVFQFLQKILRQEPWERIALLHWLFSGPLQLSFCVWLVRACACTNAGRPCFSQDCAAQPSQAQRQYSRWKKWCSPRGRTTLLDFPFPAAGPRSMDRMVASTWDPQLIAADFKIVRPLTGELAWVECLHLHHRR